jgi:catechol-2,3-dioxygenase
MPAAPASPLWPARLHHLQVTSPQPGALEAFYTRVFAYRARALPDGRRHLAVGWRRLLLAPGPARGLDFAAFAVGSAAQLAALRAHVEAQGLAPGPSPTPLFAAGAFAVRDPEGRGVVFGLPVDDGAAQGPPGGGEEAHDTTPEVLLGRLQHVVVTTLDLAAVQHFYERQLGFVPSDWVVQEGGVPTTVFYRSDPEHHSIAAFLSDAVRLDHHALDVPDWNAIRDWCDHFAAEHTPMVWGPGRHGPGNNLFCMVTDPDGNMVEISAELEQMARDVPPREWPHTEHTLNRWGSAILRI